MRDLAVAFGGLRLGRSVHGCLGRTLFGRSFLGLFLRFNLRALLRVLDQERRLQLVLQLRVPGQHLAALRGRGQCPVNLAHRALRIREGNRVGLVLLIVQHVADIAELVRLHQILQPSLHLFELGG